jgi:hypothetical protein
VIRLLLALLLPTAAHAQQIDTVALRTHTRILSHDSLQGRDTGSRGERIAASYIQTELRRLRVAPVSANGYALPIPLRRSVIDTATLALVHGNDSTTYDLDDFAINTGGERALRGFEGAALLVGTAEHALQVPDTALNGLVLVVLGTLGRDAGTLVPRWLAAGVRAVIMLVPDSAQFDLFDRSRGEVRYYLGVAVNEPIWQSQLPMLIGGPRLTRDLIAGFEIQVGRMIRNGAFAPIPLQKRVRLTLQSSTEDLTAHNILGIVPGSNPQLRGQVVLYTAHYDHLGIGPPDARGDSIYNGFSDNAAGVAMLLAIAQELNRSPPERSVAFLFLTGEERGLLGSTFYVTQPAFPLDSIAAVINLDAGAPPAPPLEWRVAGGALSRLGLLAQGVARQHGWQTELGEASPNSDYWPFHTRGVPAVFLIPGARWEGLSSAQRDALRARWDRYHRADDEWSESFPFSGLQRYALFALELGRAAASSSYVHPCPEHRDAPTRAYQRACSQ